MFLLQLVIDVVRGSGGGALPLPPGSN